MNNRVLICGFDEVGRGCLAGPIVAVGATFISQQDLSLHLSPIPGLKDSKKFSNRAARKLIFQTLIRSPHLIDFGIGCVDVDRINEIGIDAANQEAFHQALENLKYEPDYVVVDGVHPVPHFQVSCQHVEPKADNKYYPVSAASILAKVIRDELMRELHSDWPTYGWSENYGYGTDQHCQAIKQFGPCALHRTHFIRKIMNSEQPSG